MMKRVETHHLYIFERDGKFYDPTCRVVEVRNGRALQDIEAWLKRFTNVDKYPVQVAERLNPKGEWEYIVTQYDGDKERFKLVNFDAVKQFKRHKA